MQRIRQRTGKRTEQGFTAIELLVVLVLIGIMLAVAVPSYLSFRDHVASNDAKANLRAALPATEKYFAAHGTYVGMATTDLIAYDQSVSNMLTVTSVSKTGYCLTDSVGNETWSMRGPDPTTADYTRGGDCS
jgi:prepilin-type N-terminal cleavage/methylation domain-containing protein